MRITRLVAVIAIFAGWALASQPPSLFDSSRHMRVDEVKPGMKGYGLSVFHGTKIERFDVEVVSVLRNFNPKHDVILIRCRGANLEHTGAISGMSGSPIYLVDEQGRQRMIGAFAYGWPLLKDPLAGVQPIEYMLNLPDVSHKDSENASNSGAARASERERSSGPIHWSINDVMPLPGASVPKAFPTMGLRSLEPNPGYFGQYSDANLRPLASPLMVGGVPATVLEAFSPLLRAYGVAPLQAGGSSSGRPKPETASVQLTPGGVLAVPMVSGDIDLTAIGTVTEVIGDRVFGFGHPFNNEGPVSLPMGTGEINGILARLDQSMKLGSLTRRTGAVTADQTVGVAGKIGDTPRTASIDLRVIYADGSHDLSYHFESAIHPRWTPLLSGLALASSISGSRDLPRYHTLKYDLKMEFSNGQVVESSDVAVNAGVGWVLHSIVFPLVAASENPFEKVALKRVSGTVNVIDRAMESTILSVNVPKLKYKPGETLRAFVTNRPFRGAEDILPIDLKLPSDLTDGTYQLVVSGWTRYMSDEQAAQPFRFSAENAEQMFDVIRDVTSLRHNALYVRLLRQPDGVAVGRVALPRLPSSRRQVLLGAGRSNTTPFVSSTVKTIPTEFVMEGEADFSIEIDADERIETAAGVKSPQKLEPHTTPTAPPTESKLPKAGKTEPDRPDPIKPDKDLPDSPESPGDGQ